jgi:hypothetical protein
MRRWLFVVGLAEQLNNLYLGAPVLDDLGAGQAQLGAIDDGLTGYYIDAFSSAE